MANTDIGVGDPQTVVVNTLYHTTVTRCRYQQHLHRCAPAKCFVHCLTQTQVEKQELNSCLSFSHERPINNEGHLPRIKQLQAMSNDFLWWRSRPR